MASLRSQRTQFERICKSDPHVWGLISMLYQQLNTVTFNAPPSYTDKWANDLERTDLSKIRMATKFSSNILAIKTNYKVLACWYLVPTRIAKFVPSYPGRDMFLRLLSSWHPHTRLVAMPCCSRVLESIFSMASKVLKTNIDTDTATAYLSLKPAELTRTQFQLLL